MEAFFLPAGQGQRFCVHHPSAVDRGVGVVFVHGFAEEMNKSRHVVAQTARRLAACGAGVLTIDLCGCGDSSGDLQDARWDEWRADVGLALDWMRGHGYRTLWLWGMRTGAVLAATAARDARGAVARCILWQPTASGEAALTQFLRLRSAQTMLAGTPGAESIRQLRARLSAGETFEVAGYRLSPALAQDLGGLDLEQLQPPCAVHWVEIVSQGGREVTVASARVIAAWRRSGTPVTIRSLVAEPFWAATNAVELVQCPSIVDMTAADATTWM